MPRAREERREGREEQRVADGLAGALGDQCLGRGSLAEQRLAQLLVGRVQFVAQVLVVGERGEQLEQARDVLRRRRAHERRRRRRSHG